MNNSGNIDQTLNLNAIAEEPVDSMIIKHGGVLDGAEEEDEKE